MKISTILVIVLFVLMEIDSSSSETGETTKKPKKPPQVESNLNKTAAVIAEVEVNAASNANPSLILDVLIDALIKNLKPDSNFRLCFAIKFQGISKKAVGPVGPKNKTMRLYYGFPVESLRFNAVSLNKSKNIILTQATSPERQVDGVRKATAASSIYPPWCSDHAKRTGAPTLLVDIEVQSEAYLKNEEKMKKKLESEKNEKKSPRGKMLVFLSQVRKLKENDTLYMVIFDFKGEKETVRVWSDTATFADYEEKIDNLTIKVRRLFDEMLMRCNYTINRSKDCYYSDDGKSCLNRITRTPVNITPPLKSKNKKGDWNYRYCLNSRAYVDDSKRCPNKTACDLECQAREGWGPCNSSSDSCDGGYRAKIIVKNISDTNKIFNCPIQKNRKKIYEKCRSACVRAFPPWAMSLAVVGAVLIVALVAFLLYWFMVRPMRQRDRRKSLISSVMMPTTDLPPPEKQQVKKTAGSSKGSTGSSKASSKVKSDGKQPSEKSLNKKKA